MRTSEVEVPADVAWREPGLRVRLAAGSETLAARAPASPGAAKTPAASGVAILVRPGIGLDEHWALEGTFRYTALTEGVEGLRWSGTLEGSYRVGRGSWLSGLILGAGAGYGGILGQLPLGYESVSAGAEERPLRIQHCSQGGVAIVARAEWMFDVGELFATGPLVQVDQQWIVCTDRLSEFVAPTDEFGQTRWDLGRTVERDLVERWRHEGLTLAWVLAWR